ncbi:MAG: hypothetical protein ACQEXJ_15030 [Myxococcota bacterium]
MRRLVLASLGAILYALLVALPMAHVSAWAARAPDSVALGLAALPVVAWAVAVARPAPWATLWLFPVSHLPVLVAHPDLTGRPVYAGVDGMLALGAVVAVGAAWCGVALAAPRPRRARRPLRDRLREALLPAGTAVSLVLVLTAFVAPVLADDRAADVAPSQLAVLAGVAVAAHVGGRRVVGDLGDLWFDGGERERWLAHVLAERRPSPRALAASLVIAALLAALVVFVYGL